MVLEVFPDCSYEVIQLTQRPDFPELIISVALGFEFHQPSFYFIYLVPYDRYPNPVWVFHFIYQHIT